MSGHFEARTEETRDDWETPPEVFGPLHEEFGFELDAAASSWNAKAARHFDEQANGLLQRWGPGPTWLNPPYGPALPDWMKKAHYEGKRCLVVVLIPARTDTRWWHRSVMQGAAEVRLVQGRIRFLQNGQPGDLPTFPSAVVIYRPGHIGPPVFTRWRVPDPGQHVLFGEETAGG